MGIVEEFDEASRKFNEKVVDPMLGEQPEPGRTLARAMLNSLYNLAWGLWQQDMAVEDKRGQLSNAVMPYMALVADYMDAPEAFEEFGAKIGSILKDLQAHEEKPDH